MAPRGGLGRQADQRGRDYCPFGGRGRTPPNTPQTRAHHDGQGPVGADECTLSAGVRGRGPLLTGCHRAPSQEMLLFEDDESSKQAIHPDRYRLCAICFGCLRFCGTGLGCCNSGLAEIRLSSWNIPRCLRRDLFLRRAGNRPTRKGVLQLSNGQC